MTDFYRFQPVSTLLGPVFHLLVAFVLIKFVKFSIRNQHSTGWERLEFDFPLSIFIIPAVNFGSLRRHIPLHLELLHCLHLVDRRFFSLGDWKLTLNQMWLWLDFVNGHPSNNHSWCLQMYSFMLNSHQNDPEWAVPIDFGIFTLVYKFQNHCLDFVSVFFCLFHTWPLVMCLVQVIPIHLVHSHCKHWLKTRVDSFRYEACIQHFVNKKWGRMSVVEDQWMPQRFIFFVIRSRLLYQSE